MGHMEELKSLLEKNADKPIPPNKYPGTNWQIVHHRIQRAKEGVANCQCDKCVPYMKLMQS